MGASKTIIERAVDMWSLNVGLDYQISMPKAEISTQHYRYGHASKPPIELNGKETTHELYVLMSAAAKFNGLRCLKE